MGENCDNRNKTHTHKTLLLAFGFLPLEMSNQNYLRFHLVFCRKKLLMRQAGLLKMSYHYLLSTKRKKLLVLLHFTTEKMASPLMNMMSRLLK